MALRVKRGRWGYPTKWFSPGRRRLTTYQASLPSRRGWNTLLASIRTSMHIRNAIRSTPQEDAKVMRTFGWHGQSRSLKSTPTYHFLLPLSYNSSFGACKVLVQYWDEKTSHVMSAASRRLSISSYLPEETLGHWGCVNIYHTYATPCLLFTFCPWLTGVVFNY